MMKRLKIANITTMTLICCVVFTFTAARTAASEELSGPARHFKTNVERISFDAPTVAPMAFVRFCLKYPGDCNIDRTALPLPPVSLTAARMAELIAVNREVNRTIAPQANNDVMLEEWLVSPRKGDCNDYAVTKRHELLARGWPSQSLLLTEVVTSSAKHHLVLIVRTREEDLILDNLNRDLRLLSQVHYKFVRAQQEKNPNFWAMVNVTRRGQVAMNAN